MRRVTRAAALGIAFLMAARAAGGAEACGRAEDVEAIRAARQALLDAFNRGDAKAVAACWTPDGDVINASGQLIRGREAIEREFAMFFQEEKGARLETTPIQLRFMDPGVAVVDGTSQRVPAPKGPPVRSRYTAILVKRGGRWLISGVRQAVTFPPSHYEHLADLEWMIGQWQYGTPEPEKPYVETTCRWADDKNYIVRQFSVRLNEQEQFAGTTRIGWDPAARAIRSWVFESDGSIFEGTWKKQDNRWVVDLSGTLADGARVSETNVFTPVDEDHIEFQSIKRTRGGRPEPDIPKFTIRRVPPAK